MRRLLSLLVVLGACLVAAPALATVIVPVPEADLVAHAQAVVIGRVSAIESHAQGGRIVTNVGLVVDETLKGDSVPTLTLRLLGGRAGGKEAWVDGSPEFRRGERVLVFVSAHRDGVARVAHLYQGKFSIVRDAGGEDLAVRPTPAGVQLPGGAAAPATAPRRLRELKDAIRNHDLARPAPRGRLRALASATAPATAITEAHDSFTLLGSPSRWFEPDSGQPVRLKINSAGEPLAPGGGFGQIRDAFAAWSGVPGSSFRYEDGGVTTAGGFTNDGVSAISFRDPLGDIDAPVNCTGTLAYGGYFRSGATKTVNGQTFYRIVEGDIVFADGWNGCGFYETYANMAEVAAHELGHVLGLDHSTDADATMNAYAHFDGRGAAIRADDMAGLRHIYPAAAAPSALGVAFASPAAGATVSATTTVTLTASGGSGYTYTLKVDGTAVTGAGPTYAWNTKTVANGAHTLTATVTDALSRTATASQSVVVSNTTAPPTGSLQVAITQPAAGTTVKGTAWAVLWLTGAAGGSNSVTLTLGGRTVGTTTSATAGPISMTYDTTLTGDGAHTLTASARDAAGKTGTGSVSVTVSNGAAAPPPPAPPPAPLTAAVGTPAPGSTVNGTTTVTMSAAGGTAPYTYTLALDGATLTSGASTSYAWNTTSASNASHTLTLTARDAAGATATATRSVAVNNPVTPPPPPLPPTGTLKVAITQPAAGTTVKGTAWAVIWLTGAAGGSKSVTLTLGGRTVGTITSAGAGPISMPYDSTPAPDGAQLLTATARDATANTGAWSVTVNVANGALTPPPPPPPAPALVAAITAPAAGATVSGTTTVFMSASGGTAPYTYTLALDGTTLVSSGAASYAWSTASASNASHTLTLTARDAAGATATATRTVTVDNPVTPPPPPQPPPPMATLKIFITQPAGGATVRGTVWATLWVEGQSGSSNTFTLSANGQVVASQVTASRGPVTLPWVTTGTANGAVTLTGSVKDATARTGSTSIKVTVGN